MILSARIELNRTFTSAPFEGISVVEPQILNTSMPFFNTNLQYLSKFEISKESDSPI